MNKYKKILVKYKNKTYTVINPGDYLYDSKGYLLDENLPRMGRYRSVYLSKTYNLTEKDYYIILFCDGKEENLPICQLDGCNNYRQFNHLLPTKRIPILSKGCCENHTRKINGILEQNISKIMDYIKIKLRVYQELLITQRLDINIKRMLQSVSNEYLLEKRENRSLQSILISRH